MHPGCAGGMSPQNLWTDQATQRTVTLSSSKTQGTRQQLSNKEVLTEGASDVQNALDFRQSLVVCLSCSVKITLVNRRRVETVIELMNFNQPCCAIYACSACGKHTLFQLTRTSPECCVKFIKYYLCSVSRP